MDINRACHSVFCGRLETCFPGEMILDTTRPGLGLAQPCKSRLFSCLTVQSRPPFPFTFCFLPPVNFSGAVRAVFPPVGAWDESLTADDAPLQIHAPVNLRFQCLVQRQDRPPKPLTADGERNRLRTGAGVPIVKDNAVAVLTVTALPPYQGVGLFPLHWCHAVRRAVRLTLQWRQAFIWIFYHASLRLFSRCRSPRKGFLPHFCGVFRRWHAPHSFGSLWPEATSGHFVQKSALCVLPPPDIPFRTVILFSRCRPSMN